ncbi:MAG: V4R domain-containing protein [Nitrososphaerota archaeon]
MAQTMTQSEEIEHIVKHVEVFRYMPDRKLVQIILNLKNEPGALAEATVSISSWGLNILYCSAYAANEHGFADIIAEQRKDCDIISVQQKLESLHSVNKANIKQADQGLIVDSDSYPVMLSSGQSAVILRKELIASMLKSTRDAFGSGGEVIVYQQGKASGKNEALWLIKVLGEERLINNVQYLLRIFGAFGWGKAELVSFNMQPFKGIIRFYDSFECSVQSDRPYSQFIRGFISGLAETIFGIKAKCSENKCRAAGDSYCEFEISADVQCSL